MTKCDGLIPTSASYICSDHFTKDDYLFSNSKQLKVNSVASVFKFHDHLYPKKLKRKPAMRTVIANDLLSPATQLTSVAM